MPSWWSWRNHNCVHIEERHHVIPSTILGRIPWTRGIAGRRRKKLGRFEAISAIASVSQLVASEGIVERSASYPAHVVGHRCTAEGVFVQYLDGAGIAITPFPSTGSSRRRWTDGNLRAVENVHLKATAAVLVGLASTFDVAVGRGCSSSRRHVVAAEALLPVLESSKTILETGTCFFTHRWSHCCAGKSVGIHGGPSWIVDPTSDIVGGMLLCDILEAPSGNRRIVYLNGCRSPARQCCISGTGLVALTVRKPLAASELVRAEAGFDKSLVSFQAR